MKYEWKEQRSYIYLYIDDIYIDSIYMLASGSFNFTVGGEKYTFSTLDRAKKELIKKLILNKEDEITKNHSTWSTRVKELKKLQELNQIL